MHMSKGCYVGTVGVSVVDVMKLQGKSCFLIINTCSFKFKQDLIIKYLLNSDYIVAIRKMYQ